MNLLGLPGVSHAAPRRTARAVLRRDDGLFAVMHISKYGVYILPGGGMEDGEAVEEAMRREIAEETGCRCYDVRELGAVKENRAHADYTVESFYFAARTHGQDVAVAMTQEEIDNGIMVEWYSMDKLMHLIGDPVHEVRQRVFLQARDMAALNEYIKQNGAE